MMQYQPTKMNNNEIIHYSALSDKEIAKFDAEMFAKYIEFWSNFRDFSEIPNLPYDNLHSMIPGDVVTMNNGEFLLQKMTGGTLKRVFRYPDELEQLISKKRYKHFMIIHRLQTPSFYDLSTSEFYIYVKDYDNSCAPNWKYVKEYVGGIQYLNDTRNIWRDGSMDHHEYVLLFHNEAELKPSFHLQKIITRIIKTAKQHDIPLSKPSQVGIDIATTTNHPMNPLIAPPKICTDQEADDLWIFVIYISMLILLLYFTL